MHNMENFIADHHRKMRVKKEEREAKRKNFEAATSRRYAEMKAQLTEDRADIHRRLHSIKKAEYEAAVAAIAQIKSDFSTISANLTSQEAEEIKLIDLKIDGLAEQERSEVETWKNKTKEDWQVIDDQDAKALYLALQQLDENMSQTPVESSITSSPLFPEPATNSHADSDTRIGHELPAIATAMKRSLGTIQSDEDGDDIPLVLARGKKIKLVGQKAPADVPMIQMSAVEKQEGVWELPKGSKAYYVLRCPECPEKRFYQLHSILFHYNNKFRMHGFTLGQAEVVERCGILVQDATVAWVMAHNKAFVDLKKAIAVTKSRSGSSINKTTTSYKLKTSRAGLESADNDGETTEQIETETQQGTETIKSSEQRKESSREPVPAADDSALAAPLVAGSDGIFHNPRSMKGVPSKKIDENSEYWETRWNTWDSFVVKCDDQGIEYSGSKKTRKTRREIQEFFNEFPYHLNQLLGKSYIGSLGTGLIAGNTPTELHRILLRLNQAKERGKISIDPSDWLRRRLIKVVEDVESQGTRTSLKRIITDFRNDEELRKVCAPEHRIEAARESSNGEELDVLVNHQGSLEVDGNNGSDKSGEHPVNQPSTGSYTSQLPWQSDENYRSECQASEGLEKEQEIQVQSHQPVEAHEKLPYTGRKDALGLSYVTREMDDNPLDFGSKLDRSLEKPVPINGFELSSPSSVCKTRRKDPNTQTTIVVESALEKLSHTQLYSDQSVQAQDLSAKPAARSGPQGSDEVGASTPDSRQTPITVEPDPCVGSGVHSRASSQNHMQHQGQRSVESTQDQCGASSTIRKATIQSPAEPNTGPPSDLPIDHVSFSSPATDSGYLQSPVRTPSRDSIQSVNGTKSTSTFNLEYLRVQDKEIRGGSSLSFQLNNETGHLEPFLKVKNVQKPSGCDDLIINPKDVISLSYSTRATPNDTVSLVKKITQGPLSGAGSIKIECTFKFAHDAVRFFRILWTTGVYVKET